MQHPPVAEIPPTHCPAGHEFGPRRVVVGWDTSHEPPCRVYVCLVCDSRVWVERIRYRTV